MGDHESPAPEEREVNRRTVLHSIGAGMGVGAVGVGATDIATADSEDIRVETSEDVPVGKVLESPAIEALHREIRAPQLGDGRGGRLNLHPDQAERTRVYIDGTQAFDTTLIPTDQGKIVCDTTGDDATFLFDGDAWYPSEVHDATRGQEAALIVHDGELLFSRDANEEELRRIGSRLDEEPTELSAAKVSREGRETVYRVFGVNEGEVIEIGTDLNEYTTQQAQPNSCAVPCGLCAAAAPVCVGCAVACKTGIGVPACLKCLFSVCGIDATACYSCYSCIT